ncbi:MAG: ISL3 family transposase, partial [Rhodothermales bacterium]
MNEAQFYQDLLGLERLTVTLIEASPRRIVVHANYEVETSRCPVCLGPTRLVNQYDIRKVQDLSISGKEVWLHLRLPQFVCPKCDRYFMATPDWIMPGKSYTRRQAKWIFELCAKQPFTEVAALVNLSHKTVERLYYAFAKQSLDMAERYSRVRRLGIDELSHRKGKQDYVCVLTDLDRGVQLDVLPDRKKQTLKAHFEQLGTDFCNQIEVVACDIWRPYIDVAQACFTGAEIVIDRFHVVKALNEVLDKIRKRLRRDFKHEACFKNIKWKLFKRDCTIDEHKQLQEAFSKSWILEEVYQLRNTFHAMFDLARDKSQLCSEFDHWIAHAQALGNEHLDTFLKTLKRWKEPIAAYASNRITNAVTEGLNNYLRYFKRISFGLPN